MNPDTILVIDFTLLFIVCCLYAVIIHRVRGWYIRENRTWVMVVIGTLLILCAIGALVPFGIIDLATLGICILACCVAGAPIVVGQFIQDARDRALNEAMRDNHDDENSRR